MARAGHIGGRDHHRELPLGVVLIHIFPLNRIAHRQWHVSEVTACKAVLLHTNVHTNRSVCGTANNTGMAYHSVRSTHRVYNSLY